jgi:hypothetical protein
MGSTWRLAFGCSNSVRCCELITPPRVPEYARLLAFQRTQIKLLDRADRRSIFRKKEAANLLKKSWSYFILLLVIVAGERRRLGPGAGSGSGICNLRAIEHLAQSAKAVFGRDTRAESGPEERASQKGTISLESLR